MYRVVTAALVFAFSLSAASDCCAGWHEFWNGIKTDFRRNNCWPEPFYHTDRAAKRAPMAIMVNNGWQRQNTLSDYHFDSETNELTHSGAVKLHWIITQTPLNRRTVYVLDGLTQDTTATRVDSVQQAVAKILPDGPMPPVMRTSVIPRTTPSETVDAINRKAIASQPDPVLPKLMINGNTDQ